MIISYSYELIYRAMLVSTITFLMLVIGTTGYTTSSVPYGWAAYVACPEETYSCGSCNNGCTHGCMWETGWHYNARYDVVWTKYSTWEDFDYLPYPNCFQEWDCEVVLDFSGIDWYDFAICCINCQSFSLWGTPAQLLEGLTVPGHFQSLTAWISCMYCFNSLNIQVCDYVKECRKSNNVRYYDAIIGRVKLMHNYYPFQYICIPSL